jgi:hypothetical protein
MQSVINQHNYEEYFLLYVDEELSASDKQAVEQFILANPDLGVEIETLRQIRLTDEPMLFGEKESLYRTEATEINLANYKEQFLLYVDNELSVETKEKVEIFVLQHPELQKMFTELRQTKLEPERIVFAEKQLLYKKEDKEKPVFYISWQRVAVAAALIGLTVLVWTILPDNKIPQQNFAGNRATPVIKNSSVEPDGINRDIKAVDAPAANIASVNRTLTSSKSDSKTIVGNAPDNTYTLVALNNIRVKQLETQKEGIIATNTHTDFETVAIATQKVSGENAVVENIDMTRTAIAPDENNSNPATNSDQATPAAYKELDTEDEKKSLLLGSLEINKDKLRGFFRKASSIFRKAKTEEDKTESRPSSNTRSLK